MKLLVLAMVGKLKTPDATLPVMISVTLFNLGQVVTSEQMTIKLKLVPLSKVLETNLLL